MQSIMTNENGFQMFEGCFDGMEHFRQVHQRDAEEQPGEDKPVPGMIPNEPKRHREAKQVKIFIKRSYQTDKLEVSLLRDRDYLIKKVSEIPPKIHPSQISLKFNGKELGDDVTLQDAGIKHGSTLTLQLTIRGGGGSFQIEQS